jgi:nucleotide-binding universal stress UspA family protein
MRLHVDKLVQSSLTQFVQTVIKVAPDPVEDAATDLVRLAAGRAYLEKEGLTAEYVEALGSPGASIVTLADQRSADLIVVGTGERGMLERLFGSAVSDNVAHHAHCDVVIVH